MLDAQHFGADRKAAEYKGLRGLHHDSDNASHDSSITKFPQPQLKPRQLDHKPTTSAEADCELSATLSLLF